MSGKQQAEVCEVQKDSKCGADFCQDPAFLSRLPLPVADQLNDGCNWESSATAFEW